MKESIDIKSSHPDQFSTYIKVSVYLYQAFFFQMSALFGSSRKLWQSCKKNYRAPHLQEKVHLQSRRAQNLVSSQAPLHSCNYPAPAYNYNIFIIFIDVDCSEDQWFFLEFLPMLFRKFRKLPPATFWQPSLTSAPPSSPSSSPRSQAWWSPSAES